MPDLLLRLSDFLNTVLTDVERLETTISRNSGNGCGVAEETMVELQSLDHVRQSVRDMAVLTRLMANSGLPHRLSAYELASAANQLDLAVSRELLMIDDVQYLHTGKVPLSGEVELF